MRRNATLKGRRVKKRKKEKKNKKKMKKRQKKRKKKRRRPYHIEYAKVITECD